MDRKPGGLVEDAMMAAVARDHRLIVATRNERDFVQLDVPILNPFKNQFVSKLQDASYSPRSTRVARSSPLEARSLTATQPGPAVV
jgi:hypothetical protein